jgi:hypothetical protein
MLLIMQFSPVSCHFLPLQSKHSVHHQVLKHHWSVIHIVEETKFRIHLKEHVQLQFYIF